MRFIVASTKAVSVAIAMSAFAAFSVAAESDLDRAYRTIAAKQFVDLTHSFEPDTPVWSGFGQATMSAGRAIRRRKEPYTIEQGRLSHDDLFDGRASTGRTSIRRRISPQRRHDDGRDSAEADDPAARRARHDAAPAPGSPIMRSRSTTSGRGRKSTGTSRTASFAALRTDMCKDWTAIPSASSAHRFRPGRWRRSNSCTSREGDGHRARVARHRHHRQDGFGDVAPAAGHYQIEAMANLDQVPPAAPSSS